MDMMSGKALSRFTVFALGIMPYISASIIMQLMSYVVPTLEALKKEGESGPAQDHAVHALRHARSGGVPGAGHRARTRRLAGPRHQPGFGFRMTTMVSSGRRNDVPDVARRADHRTRPGQRHFDRHLRRHRGGAAERDRRLLGLVSSGAMSYPIALFIVAIVGLVTFVVVFVERGQRKILVNYAKRQVGNKVYGGQSSHLPLKLNMAGVIPPIFASSIILLPATVVGWFATGDGLRWLKDIAGLLSPGQPIYVMLYAAAIIFFCFFYTALVFNSRETADNLKKSGAFIPGIRPGEQTARHIDRILSRLTLAGAIYITGVCLLPEFLVLKYNVPFYFGGTSLLIIVVVTMDFWAQVQSYVMSQQYESLLKKANFKAG
jgi:preprotein translocase subunit SecY